MKSLLPRMLRVVRDYGVVLLLLALFIGVTLLPPDTSLQQVKQRGVLTACVPPAGGTETTFERALLAAISERMGLRFAVYEVPAMATNFDLRNWGVNRAQCVVLAAGLTDTPWTRAFNDVSPPYGESGLVALTGGEHETITGLKVSVPANLQDVDRLALSRFLRQEKAAVRLANSADAALSLLRSGEVDAAIVPSQEATTSESRWTAAISLPPPLDANPLVFGLWKGDLTFKRAFADALQSLKADGSIGEIREKLASSGS